jgi:hypothetical protein
LPHKSTRSISLIFLAAAAVCTSATAGQNPAPPTIEEQLQAEYKLVKMGGDASGPSVIEPGTVLVIQKAGILGVPPRALVYCASKFEDGAFRPAGNSCSNMMKNASRMFQTGEKVYPLKIEVKPKNDKVTVRFIACDACNGTNPPTAFKGAVDFIFPKGALDNPDASKIEDAIGKVFSIDDSAAEAPPAPAAADANQPPPAAAAPAAPAQPVSIDIGMTIDQVVAALGQPQKMVNLGAKKIYVYKDLKVTFLDGKVSDVQ